MRHAAPVARHARRDRRVVGRSASTHLRAVALVGLATVVLAGGLGLLRTDDGSSAAFAPPLPGGVPIDVPISAWPSESTPSDVRPPRGLPLPGSPTTDWAAVLGQLDRARSTAFGLGDVALLSTVYAAGSAPLRRDASALLALATAGVRAAGMRLVVDDVSILEAGATRVVLRVVDHMPAYVLLRGDGSVAEQRPGRGAAEWTMTLVDGDQGWRIGAITDG
jgi:hypothetical protein